MKKEKEACCEALEEDLLHKKEDSLIFQFHQLHNTMFRAANKKIESSSVPIKMEQLPVLMTLYYFKEQPQQSLADLINRDKSSVLRTARALEKRGLLTYKKDKTDARRKVLTLTETGVFVAIKVEGLVKEIENGIGEALSDRPKKEILELLKKATKRLEILTNS